MKCDVKMFTNKWSAMWKCSRTNEVKIFMNKWSAIRKGSRTKEMGSSWINGQEKLVMGTFTNKRILQWLMLVSHPNSIVIFRPPSYSEKRSSTEGSWRAVGLKDLLQAAMTWKSPRHQLELEPHSKYPIVANKTRKNNTRDIDTRITAFWVKMSRV
jgi:hypothetical protein